MLDGRPSAAVPRGVRCRACACPLMSPQLRIARVTWWDSDRTASISSPCCASSRPATRNSASNVSPASRAGRSHLQWSAAHVSAGAPATSVGSDRDELGRDRAEQSHRRGGGRGGRRSHRRSAHPLCDDPRRRPHRATARCCGTETHVSRSPAPTSRPTPWAPRACCSLTATTSRLSVAAATVARAAGVVTAIDVEAVRPRPRSPAAVDRHRDCLRGLS